MLSLKDVFDEQQSFRIPEKKFTQQYASIYFCRLITLRSIILNRLAKDSVDPTCTLLVVFLDSRIADMNGGAKAMVIGSVFIDDPSKPSMLMELGAVEPMAGDCARRVFLEDESGRIELDLGECTGETIISGTVVAVRGSESGGLFKVSSVIHAGIPACEPRACNRRLRVLFVSDCDVTSNAWNILVEHVTSQVAGISHWYQTNVDAVVLVGNCIGRGQRTVESTKKYGQEIVKIDTSSIKKAAHDLGYIAKTSRCCIVPGSNDPTNVMLPQQPLPKSLINLDPDGASILCSWNPSLLDLDGARVLCLSGESVLDCAKYSFSPRGPLGALDVAECMLNDRHIAPTSPDTTCTTTFVTIGCYPFIDRDPFILTECPDVFVVGNQEQFSTRTVTGGASVVYLNRQRSSVRSAGNTVF